MHEVTNLAALVRRNAVERPNRPALRWGDQVLTWAEFDARVDAVAGGLTSLVAGGPGGTDAALPPRVAVALPNVVEFAVAFFAILRAGLVAVPVNPGYAGRELTHIITDSGASTLIGTPGVLAAVDGPEHRIVVGEPHVGARPFADLAADGTPTPVANPADIAVLLYTSGTSGAPKGAMLTNRALIANHEQLARLQPSPLLPDDVLLLAVPLFHAYGLNSGLGAIAYHGACGVLIEHFDPAETLAAININAVTAVVGVPPMYVAWSLMGAAPAEAFANVRLVVSGAAPLDAAATRRFAEVTGRAIHEGYGLTETAPVLTSTLGSGRAKPGSIGRPIPGVELKLVDASGLEIALDDDDFDIAPGSPGTDPGEIVVRGENLFSGYWPDGSGGPDPDGWWATGDVAYADADGDLFIVDRLGELILVSGFNVYPHEVEMVLAAHPAVVEAAVVGMPHERSGQTVRAYVVREPGATVTVEELRLHCERSLARFKCPTAIQFIPELPHSATGKVRKAALRSVS